MSEIDWEQRAKKTEAELEAFRKNASKSLLRDILCGVGLLLLLTLSCCVVWYVCRSWYWGEINSRVTKVALEITEGNSEKEAWSQVGTMGDSYGALNAIFTGFGVAVSLMAFIGFLLALWMQREDLRLQRHEMQNTRKEMEAQTHLHREELIEAAWNEVRVRMDELREGFKKKAIPADDMFLHTATMLEEGMRQCCSRDSANTWFFSKPLGDNWTRARYLEGLRQVFEGLFRWIEPISNYVVKVYLQNDVSVDFNLCEHRLRTFTQVFSEQEYRVFCLCMLYCRAADKLPEDSDFSRESCLSQLGISDYAAYVIDKIVIKEEAIALSLEEIACEASRHLKPGEKPEEPVDTKPKGMVHPEVRACVSAPLFDDDRGFVEPSDPTTR